MRLRINCSPLRTRLKKNNKGIAALEFALLLPVCLLLFFAFLDFGWYLTNLLVLENAVSSGSRSGVKVRYWLEPDDEAYLDPRDVARQIVQRNFWTGRIRDEDIIVNLKDEDQQVVQEDENFTYLEVKVINYDYGIMTGYLPFGMIPDRIAACSMTSFP